MHTSTAVTVVRSELRYPRCKPHLYCEQRSSCISYALMKNTVGAFDWFLFLVLHTGPRKFKPRTNGIGFFRESHGAMPLAGPVVVVDYRTHLGLPVIQSNVPKLIKLHPSSIYLIILAKLRLDS